MKKLLFIILLFISTLTIAQTKNSSGNGEWATVVQPSYTVGFGNTVNINHIVTSNNLIQVQFGGNLNIGNSIGDSLIINAGLTTVIGGNITVNVGAVLFINGNLNNTIWGDIIVYGTLLIDGNLNNSNSNIIIPNGGVLGVSGNITNSGGGVIDNDGTISVGGIIIGTLPIGSGDVTIHDSDPLPIELIYFKAYYSVNSAILEWSTATETNNNYFTIEYSTDIINWEVLDYVSGADNSNSELKYTYAHITKNNYYYRLSQVDFDGKSETFNIVYVNTPYINEDNIYNVYDNMGRYITSGNFNEIKTRLKNGQIYYLKTEHETKVYIK